MSTDYVGIAGCGHICDYESDGIDYLTKIIDHLEYFDAEENTIEHFERDECDYNDVYENIKNLNIERLSFYSDRGIFIGITANNLKDLVEAVKNMQSIDADCEFHVFAQVR